MSQFMTKLEQIRRNLLEESDDGVIKGDVLGKEIKKVAGRTVVKQYREELEEFGYIEQIPKTQKWHVNEPENRAEADLNSGKKVQKHVTIPEGLAESAEQFGLNFGTLLSEKIVEEVSTKEVFLKDYLEKDYSSEEADYIFKLVKEDLYKRKGKKREMAMRDKKRRMLYEECFDEKVTTSEQQEAMEEYRKTAFELAENIA